MDTTHLPFHTYGYGTISLIPKIGAEKKDKNTSYDYEVLYYFKKLVRQTDNPASLQILAPLDISLLPLSSLKLPMRWIRYPLGAELEAGAYVMTDPLDEGLPRIVSLPTEEMRMIV
ncbi:hypothetical protein G7Y89_g1416 [Cudoniella acicularis]|uniref:Uncharacterized protein n=1 Tax=Cudoniella acicularis TaxID=354080 RepID=A0A8H4W710_9HELO|nr:hypothetical protein G7Y89_g1416 [Cudoniella acicularis]